MVLISFFYVKFLSGGGQGMPTGELNFQYNIGWNG